MLEELTGGLAVAERLPHIAGVALPLPLFPRSHIPMLSPEWKKSIRVNAGFIAMAIAVLLGLDSMNREGWTLWVLLGFGCAIVWAHFQAQEDAEERERRVHALFGVSASNLRWLFSMSDEEMRRVLQNPQAIADYQARLAEWSARFEEPIQSPGNAPSEDP